MAFSRKYQCDSCDFSFSGSGEPDALMSGVTIPMVCEDCKKITDVFQDKKGEPIIETCTSCGSMRFSAWNYKEKPCPKCILGRLRIDPSGHFVFSD